MRDVLVSPVNSVVSNVKSPDSIIDIKAEAEKKNALRCNEVSQIAIKQRINIIILKKPKVSISNIFFTI